MARFSGAEWIGPTPNEAPGGQVDVHGLVLHIQDGSEAGSEAWFKNPESQASSHFLNPKQGGLRQLVDTSDRAWAEAAGNRHWISIENEGLGGDSLTDSQIENVAQLFAWIHNTYGSPVQSTDDPNGYGLGWHGMGGAAWGGHYDCPGEPVKAQRGRILARTNEILGGGSTPPPPSGGGSVPRQQVTIDGQVYGYGAHGDQVTTVGRLLVQNGCGSHYQVGPGPDWSDSDTLNYQAWQVKCGYSGSAADGVPGPTTMRKLLWTSGVPGFSYDLNWTGSYPSGPDNEVRVWQQHMTDRGWAINGVDGWYGPHCQEICREFQQRHGLPVTGVVDSVTWLMTWMAP